MAEIKEKKKTEKEEKELVRRWFRSLNYKKRIEIVGEHFVRWNLANYPELADLWGNLPFEERLKIYNRERSKEDV